jgi:hypothetical protein
MSRALSLALLALTLGSNALGGVAWLCHGDGLAHDEPCCEQKTSKEQAPALAEVPCCELLSQLRPTQAVERVEASTPSVVSLPVLAVLAPSTPRVLEGPTPVAALPWTGPPRPGGGPLLSQGRSLLI